VFFIVIAFALFVAALRLWLLQNVCCVLIAAVDFVWGFFVCFVGVILKIVRGFFVYECVCVGVCVFLCVGAYI